MRSHTSPNKFNTWTVILGSVVLAGLTVALVVGLISALMERDPASIPLRVDSNELGIELNNFVVIAKKRENADTHVTVQGSLLATKETCNDFAIEVAMIRDQGPSPIKSLYRVLSTNKDEPVFQVYKFEVGKSQTVSFELPTDYHREADRISVSAKLLPVRQLHEKMPADVSIEVSGEGLRGVRIGVNRDRFKADGHPMCLVCQPGVICRSTSGVQDMLLSESESLPIAANWGRAASLTAYCMNMNAPIPKKTDKFQATSIDTRSDLSLLVHSQSFKGAWTADKQFAIWTIVHNPGVDEFKSIFIPYVVPIISNGQLSSGNSYGRDLQAIFDLLRGAGINPMKYRAVAELQLQANKVQEEIQKNKAAAEKQKIAEAKRKELLPKAKELLEGKWYLKRVTSAGKQWQVEGTIVFAGNEIKEETNTVRKTFSYLLDPSVNPKTIDLFEFIKPKRVSVATQLGIYELQDNNKRLVIALSPPNAAARPLNFDNLPDQCQLRVYERTR